MPNFIYFWLILWFIYTIYLVTTTNKRIKVLNYQSKYHNLLKRALNSDLPKEEAKLFLFFYLKLFVSLLFLIMLIVITYIYETY